MNTPKKHLYISLIKCAIMDNGDNIFKFTTGTQARQLAVTSFCSGFAMTSTGLLNRASLASHDSIMVDVIIGLQQVLASFSKGLQYFILFSCQLDVTITALIIAFYAYIQTSHFSNKNTLSCKTMRHVSLPPLSSPLSQTLEEQLILLFSKLLYISNTRKLVGKREVRQHLTI